MDDNAAAADVDRYKYTADESRLLKFLKDQSVEPLANVFHSVPMGVDNSVYSIAPDIFHIFCAGLMKHLCLWIMTIIENIAKADSDYHFAKDPLWKSRTMRMMIITMTSI